MRSRNPKRLRRGNIGLGLGLGPIFSAPPIPWTFSSVMSLPAVKVWAAADKGSFGNGAVSLASASSQYLSVATALITSTPWSFAGWFQIGVLGGVENIFAVGSSIGNVKQRLRVSATNVLQIIVDGATGDIGTTVLSQNTWYHVAVTYDGTTVNVYLNGNLEITHARTATYTGSNLTLFGATVVAGVIFPTFTGLLDSWAVWSKVLSAAEIARLAAGKAIQDFAADVTLSVSAVSGYAFGSTANLTNDYIGANTLTNNGVATYAAGHVNSSGGILADGDLLQEVDLSGNNNNLTQPTTTRRAVFKTNIFGAMPGMLFATASNQYLQTAAFGVALNNPFTVLVSGRSTVGHNQTLFDGLTLGSSSFGISGPIAGNVYVISDNAGTSGGGGGTGDVSNHVFACIYNTGASKFYVDGGVSVGPIALFGTPMAGFILGGSVNLGGWDGYILEAIVCNALLSLSQLNAVGAYMAGRLGTVWTTAV